MNNHLHALFYLRVSTGRQKEKGIALPTQREQCLKRAQEYGYTVDLKKDIYSDGESAFAVDTKRPALMEMLARCKDDKSVGAVIFYDVSRLARNRIDFALIKMSLRKAGIKLLSATEPIDETPEGQMLEGVLSTVAEFFSAQSGRKVKANMKRKAESGGWPNLAPYGYKNRQEKLPGGAIRAWIEENLKEARWVKRAFELFASGQYGVKQLAKILGAEGFPVRKYRNRKSSVLHHSQLERILCNPIYIGLIHWGGVKSRGDHPAIIESELFYRVQDLLSLRRGRATRKRHHLSLFKGIAICDTCESGMTIDITHTSATRHIQYLRCRKIQKGKPVICSERYFAEDTYVDQLAQLLSHVELPQRAIDSLRQKMQTELDGERTLHERVRNDIEQQLDTLSKRRENLILRSLDDDLQGSSQKAAYDRVRADLDRGEERLSQELQRLKPRLEEFARTMEIASAIAACCRQAFDVLKDDTELRGALTRAIFTQLRMQGGKIVNATLTEPLVFIRRWASEKPVSHLADLCLPCAPNEAVADGGENCQDGMLKELESIALHLRADLQGDIETCYRELRGRGIIQGTPWSQPEGLP